MALITCMFPGQGAQRKGMGGSLFDELAPLVAAADRILGYSIRELCLDDPRGELDQTQYTQPALYVVNALAYLQRVRAGRPPPDAVIGHSLGELNALLAAGVFDFETGLRLVQRRGLVMSEATGGGMAAVMNVAADELQRILCDGGLGEIDLANFNAPNQIVISGRRDDIARAQAIFVAHGKPFVPLNTSGAFHSRYMAAARERFDAVLADAVFAEPTIPVISNYTARPYRPGEVLANLSNQLSSPVRWAEGIEYLAALGEMTFEEIGDGKALSNLVARIQKAPRPPRRAPSIAVEPAGAAEKTRRWNARFRIGIRVRSDVLDGAVLATRSEAVVLLGHRAAVYLEGYQGYFDLDELRAIE